MKLVSLISTLALFGISCSENVEDKTQQLKTSTFSASRVTPYSTLLTKLQNWGDFPSSNRIDVTTCIKNKGIHAPIINEPFAVHLPNGTKIHKTSNENGCLYWSIDKKFNFLSQEHYVSYPIKIEGVGNYKGSLDIPLSVNPWQNTANTIKDLRFDNLSSRYIRVSSEQLTSSNIHIKNVEISQRKGAFQKINSSSSYVLSYDISLWPTYKRIGLNGELIEQPFKEGNFNVVFSLMEKVPASDQYYNISTTEQQTFIKNGFLNTAIVFNIPHQRWPEGSSQLEMFIQIAPINGPKSLGIFHGTVPMKNMTQNSHRTPQQSIPEINFLTLTSQFRQEIEKDKPPRDDFIFEIDSIRAEYGSHTGQNYKKSSEKTLRSKLYLRLASTFHKELIQKTRFLITVYDQDGNNDGATQDRIATIDSNGILETYALINYNMYNCHQWRPYTIKIRAIDGQISGLEKERSVFFNPWNQSNFFYDSIKQKPPSTSNCTLPQVHLNKIEYTNEGLDRENFHLDTYLNLSIRKIYNIQFTPLLKVTSSHQKETLPPSIPYGTFTLRLDLYTPKKKQINYDKPNLNNFNYITSAEQEVAIEEGVVNTDIKMPFIIEETIALSYKNIIAITLTPKNEPYLQPSTRFFSFDVRERQRNIQTRPLNNYQMKPRDLRTLQHIRESGFKLPRGLLINNPPSPIQLFQTWLFSHSSEEDNAFLKFNQIKERNALNDPDLELTSLDQERLLHETSYLAKQTLKKICPLVYSDKHTSKEEFQDCIDNPEKHIQRRPSKHIIDIITTKSVTLKNGRTLNVPVGTYKEGINGAIQTGNRISHSRGIRSTDAIGIGDRYSIQKHFDWGIKTPGFISGSHGTSFANLDESYNRNSQAEMSTSFNFNYLEIKQNIMNFNNLTLEYEAKVLPCFSILARQKPSLQFHICDDKPRYSRMTEQWYFIADLNIKNTQFIADPGRIGDTRGPQVIRGQYNFNHFWKQLEKNSRLAVHYTALYPFKEDYTKRHLLELQKKHSNLFNRNSLEGYHFFPGLTTPTPEQK